MKQRMVPMLEFMPQKLERAPALTVPAPLLFLLRERAVPLRACVAPRARALRAVFRLFQMARAQRRGVADDAYVCLLRAE